MTYILVHDCPHCSKQQVGFTCGGYRETHSIDNPEAPLQKVGVWSFLFCCNNCKKPIAVLGYARDRNFSVNNQGCLKESNSFKIVSIFPKPQPTRIPRYLPGNIAQAYDDAEYSLRGERWNAASISYRRVLELMTKDKLPDTKGTLVNRINQLNVTNELKEWAHSLRFIGNEAAHGEINLEKADALAASNITYYLMTYIYTLPEQVRLAREGKQ